MSSDVKDWLGRDIHPGDLIVYPVREGSQMEMVLARVVYRRTLSRRSPLSGGLEVDRVLHNGRPVGQRVRGYVRRLDRVTKITDPELIRQYKDKQ